jgi:hypothetical protein
VTLPETMTRYRLFGFGLDSSSPQLVPPLPFDPADEEAAPLGTAALVLVLVAAAVVAPVVAALDVAASAAEVLALPAPAPATAELAVLAAVAAPAAALFDEL